MSKGYESYDARYLNDKDIRIIYSNINGTKGVSINKMGSILINNICNEMSNQQIYKLGMNFDHILTNVNEKITLMINRDDKMDCANEMQLIEDINNINATIIFQK